MRLVIDEMWSREVATRLAAVRHDVVAVDNHPELRGRSDDELLALAVADRRVIVAENVADFRRLARIRLQAGGSHPGLILTMKWRYSRSLAPLNRLISSIDGLARPGVTLENREHRLD